MQPEQARAEANWNVQPGPTKAGEMGWAGGGGENLRRPESWPGLGTRRGHRAADKPRETSWSGLDFRGSLRQLTKKKQKTVPDQSGVRQLRCEGGKILTKGSNPSAGQDRWQRLGTAGRKEGPGEPRWSCRAHLLPTQQRPTDGFPSSWDHRQVQLRMSRPKRGSLPQTISFSTVSQSLSTSPLSGGLFWS